MGLEVRRRVLLLALALPLSFVAGAACAYWIVLPVIYASLSDFGSDFATPSVADTDYVGPAMVILTVGFLFVAFTISSVSLGIARKND